VARSVTSARRSYPIAALLGHVAAGGPWRTAAAAQFGGRGNQGDGAAMRVAPAAFFVAGDLEVTLQLASRSARVEGGDRPRLVVQVRVRSRRRARCGRCGIVAPMYDRGGGRRRWRHVDVGFAVCELEAEAPRVACPEHGPAVADLPWAPPWQPFQPILRGRGGL
jgi:hypothetical protein